MEIRTPPHETASSEENELGDTQRSSVGVSLDTESRILASVFSTDWRCWRTGNGSVGASRRIELAGFRDARFSSSIVSARHKPRSNSSTASEAGAGSE